MKRFLLLYLVTPVFVLFSLNVSAQSWSPCGSGMGQTVYALCADTVNNVVYAGGAFARAGGAMVNYVAQWNGTTWAPMGMNMGSNYSMIGTNDTVMALCIYKGNLYAGGHFTTAEGNAAQHIAMWNGSTWTHVGTSMNGDVHAMAVYKGQLYASGEFTSVDGMNINHIARWNDTVWSAAGVGLSDDAEALIVYQGNLYAGGDFFMSGTDSCKNMAMWNGVAWSPVGTGMSTSSMMVNMGMPSMVHSLAVCNGNLYAGGMFMSAGGMSCGNLAQWNGTSWSSPGNVGSGMMSDDVTALCNYKGVLCVGGMFSSAGGQTMSNMSQCNGGVWTQLGMGTNNQVFAMTVCNGTLYSGGSYTTAGGATNDYISQYTGSAGITDLSLEQPFATSSVYPNPLNGTDATLVVNKALCSGKSELIFFDVVGQEVMTVPFDEMQKTRNGAYQFKLNSAITPGIYFYKVVDNQQQIATGKLVIR
jgi:hypothetical protein